MFMTKLMQALSSRASPNRIFEENLSGSVVMTQNAFLVETIEKKVEDRTVIRSRYAALKPGGSIVLTCKSEVGQPDAWSCEFRKGDVRSPDFVEHVIDFGARAEEAIAAYRTGRDRLRRSAVSEREERRPARWRSWIAGVMLVAIGLYALLAIIGALSSPGVKTAAQTMQPIQASPPFAYGTAPAPALAAAPAPQPAVPADAMLSASERQELARAARIELGKNGPQLVVFSDPLCPYCQNLESSLENAREFSAVIIPVGYKEGSRDLVAQALCAKDPAAAWKEVIRNGYIRSAAKPCEEGLRKVAQNNALFERLRLTSTPTIISPKKGLIVLGEMGQTELARLAVEH